VNTLANLFVVETAAAVLVVAAMTFTAYAAGRAGRYSVVDTTWGLALAGVAVLAAVLGGVLDAGDPWRSWLLAALVSIWGVRLSWHMHQRNSGHGEDARYTAMLAGSTPFQRVVKVWVTQGAAVLLVGLPVTVASVTAGGWGSVVSTCVAVGLALWLLGVSFEAVGDAQLARFKADPANHGVIMSRGLWSWTRHPNYFGDACVWWGVWLVSLTTPWSLLTIIAPLAMTYFLVFATGARLLDRHMADRPGWAEYAARTSMFFPLPPRRGARRNVRENR
jgi:steroid 5-alpha reductase family enzyme